MSKAVTAERFNGADSSWNLVYGTLRPAQHWPSATPEEIVSKRASCHQPETQGNNNASFVSKANKITKGVGVNVRQSYHSRTPTQGHKQSVLHDNDERPTQSQAATMRNRGVLVQVRKYKQREDLGRNSNLCRRHPPPRRIAHNRSRGCS